MARLIRDGSGSDAQTLLRSPKYQARCYVMYVVLYIMIKNLLKYSCLVVLIKMFSHNIVCLYRFIKKEENLSPTIYNIEIERALLSAQYCA